MIEMYDEDIERAKKVVEECINSYVELRDLNEREKEIVRDALIKVVLCDKFYYLLKDIEKIIFHILKLSRIQEEAVPEGEILKFFKSFWDTLELDKLSQDPFLNLNLDEFLKIVESSIKILEEVRDFVRRKRTIRKLEDSQFYISEINNYLIGIMATQMSKIFNVLSEKYGDLNDADKAVVVDKIFSQLGCPLKMEVYERLNIKPIERYEERRKIFKLSKAIRGEVLKRDNYACVICGSKEDLEVHHKIPCSAFLLPRNANKMENLITMCKKCHRDEHYEEYRMLTEAF